MKILHSLMLMVLFGFCASTDILAESTPVSTKMTLQSLLDDQHLSIKHELIPDKAIPGEEVTLKISISTDRWFAGGTRLKPASSDDFLLLQRQELATNSTVKEQGVTWVVQIWELSLFAQSDGQLMTPEIEAHISINAESGVVSGDYTLSSLALNVELPEELKGIKRWLASTRFDLDSSMVFNGNQSLDDLKAGDAFSRVIQIRADNVLAMMLPEIEMPSIDGLAIYQLSPELKNNNNRGKKEAIRVDTLDFVIEKEGDYQLPAMTFYWWDTANHSLHKEELEAIQFSVSGSGFKEITGNTENTVLLYWTAIILAGLCVLFLLLWFIPRRFNSKRTGSKTFLSKWLSERLSEQRIKKLIQDSIRKKDWKMTLRWAYWWLDRHQNFSPGRLKQTINNKTDQTEQLAGLFENAYSQQQLMQKQEKRQSDISPELFDPLFNKEFKPVLKIYGDTHTSNPSKQQIIDDPLQMNPR